jgi:hypothetical protein
MRTAVHSGTGFWLRPSRCNPEFNCLEVAVTGVGMVIRDSKSKIALHPLGDEQWLAFLAYCRGTR